MASLFLARLSLKYMPNKKVIEKLVEEEEKKIEGTVDLIERLSIMETFLTRRSFSTVNNDLARGQIQKQIEQANKQLKMSRDFLEFLETYKNE